MLNYLNYNGDKNHLVGKVMGPTTLNEFWIAETCEYDDNTNKSRVGVRLMSGKELEEKFDERFGGEA